MGPEPIALASPEIVRNANSWAPPQVCRMRNSGWDPAFQVILMHAEV